MTDQLWENEESLLSRKLIGRISNMKNFWSSVSDEDSIIDKKKKIKNSTNDPFAGKEYLKENIKSKTKKYANLVQANNNHASECTESKSQNDILHRLHKKTKFEFNNRSFSIYSYF